MSDSRHGSVAQPMISLVPGVIYEWTPAGVAAVEPMKPEERMPTGRASAPFVAGSEPVAGYRLVERIGEGCTGEVWRALGPGGVAVALKFVETHQRGARAELRSLASMPEVRHANLITIFGIWERDDWTAIGMDLADRSLLDRFEAATETGRGGLDLAELINFLDQAARGIDFLNEPRHVSPGQKPVSLIHRDIKPQNLLLVGGSVKVADFGLVKRLQSDPTDSPWSTDEGIESLVTAYTAPEVRRGEIARQSDQYSLAATYCHLRGGRAPSTPLTAWHSSSQNGSAPRTDAVDLSMLPARERPVVARALATNPTRRWPSCSAFVEGLIAATAGDQSDLTAPDEEAPDHSLFVPTAQRSRRVDRVVLLAAAAVLIAFASRWSGGSSPSPPVVVIRPSPIVPPSSLPPVLPSRDPVSKTALISPTSPPVPPRDEPAVDPAVQPVGQAEPVRDLELPLAGQPGLALGFSPSSAERPESHVPPASDSRDRPEPILTPAPVLLDRPIADSLDDIVAAIEAHPVAGDAGTEVSGAEIKAIIRAWVDLTWNRLGTQVVATRTTVKSWVSAIPQPAPPPARVAVRIPREPPPAQAATIIALMPSLKAELVVRGELGQGNPSEWSGPRRVIHSPPLAASRDYVVGASWTDASGRQVSRSLPLKVEPGRYYEVDLRPATPTAAEVAPPPLPHPAQLNPVPAASRKPAQEAAERKHSGPLGRLHLPRLKPNGRQAARP